MMGSPALKNNNEESTSLYRGLSWLKNSFTDKGSDYIAEVANDNRRPESSVIDFLRAKEEVEVAATQGRESVKEHTVDRYLLNAEQDSDRRLLQEDIEAANTNLAPTITEASGTWRDEDNLKGTLDGLDHKINVVQAAAEKEGESLTRNEALERLKEESNRFTTRDASGRYSMKTRGEILKDNWTARQSGEISLWKFLKRSFTDMVFEYGAMGKVIPELNLMNYAEQEVKDFKDEYGEIGEDVIDNAKAGKAALRDKKNIEKEGAEAVLLVKSGLTQFRQQASTVGKQALLNIAQGKNGMTSPKTYLMSQVDTSSLTGLQRRYPHNFAAQAERYGIKARKLRGKAAVFELSTRVFDWYLHPAYRTRSSIGAEVKEVAVGLIPFSSAYSFWDDGAAELNHLPTWAKYSILAGEFALDTVTVVGYGASLFTGGTTAPLVGTAGLAAKAGLRTGVRKLATKGVEKAALKKGVNGAMGVMSKMSAQTRAVLFSTTSAKVLTGYAALSGLSALADYVLAGAISQVVVETAEEAAEKVFDKSFTVQQKRALRMVSYMAIRQYQNRPDEAPENTALTPGQIADVTERKAA